MSKKGNKKEIEIWLSSFGKGQKNGDNLAAFWREKEKEIKESNSDTIARDAFLRKIRKHIMKAYLAGLEEEWERNGRMIENNK